MQPTVVTRKEIRSSVFIPSYKLRLLPLRKTYGESVERLGEGSYGFVFEFKKNDKSYAVKVAVDNLDEAFLREVSILIMLSHKNVINIIDCDVYPERPSIVMPLALGSLDNQKFSDEEKISLSYDICLGLAYCHMRGVLHRDIKPDNVLIFPGPTAKIADFGVARAMGCSLAVNNSRKCDLQYCAPEMILEGKQDYSVDVWSVGCTLYELFTEEPIHRAQNVEEAIQEIIKRFMPFGTVNNWLDARNLPGFREWMSVDPNIRRSLEIIKNKEMNRLVTSMLVIDPERRITMLQAVNDPVFLNVRLEGDSLPVTNCIDALDMREMYPVIYLTEKVTLKMRFYAYQWMQGVIFIKYKGASLRSLFLSMMYFDRALTLFPEISHENILLFACASLFIAMTYNEPKLIPKPEELVGIPLVDKRDRTGAIKEAGTDKFTGGDLWQTTFKILKAMRFDICTSTMHDYFSIYKTNYSEGVMKFTEGLLLMIPGTPLQSIYLSNVLTLACIKIACIVRDEKFKHEDKCKTYVDNALGRIVKACGTEVYNKYVKERTNMEGKEIIDRVNMPRAKDTPDKPPKYNDGAARLHLGRMDTPPKPIKDKPSGMNLQNLPADALRMIAWNMELGKLVGFCRTNKKLSDICKSEEFWKGYVERHQDKYPPKEEGTTWKWHARHTMKLVFRYRRDTNYVTLTTMELDLKHITEYTEKVLNYTLEEYGVFGVKIQLMEGEIFVVTVYAGLKIDITKEKGLPKRIETLVRTAIRGTIRVIYIQ